MGNLSTRTVAVICGAIFLACAIYVGIEVRKALREPSEKERIARRLMPAESGYFLAAQTPGFVMVYPAPDAACAANALPQLRAAEERAMAWDLEGAIAPAEHALSIDADCVPAAHIVVRAHGKRATHISLRNRFVGRADQERSNAAAQLQAAYYEREAGDPQAAFTYLERARAARSDQPMLDAAFGQFYSSYADPLDYRRAIESYEREYEHTRALAAAWSLIRIYSEVDDIERARQWCDRYFSAFPTSTLATAANVCMWTVLRSGDRAAEPIYLERFWQARDLVEECRHGHLASMYVDVDGRVQDALREADIAIAGGCSQYGAWPKVSALMQLRRYSEAVSVAERALPRGNRDLFRLALAVALAGDRDRAMEIAALSMRTYHPAGGSTKEEALERMHLLRELLAQDASADVLAKLHGDGEPLHPSERLGWAAGGYTGYGLYEDAARAVERALAVDPKSSGAWAARIWLHQIDEDYAAAAKAGEEALALGVGGSAVLNNLGNVYRRTGECERAIPLFERARALAPYALKTYGNLAYCLHEVGRHDEADRVRRHVMYPEAETVAWQWLAGLVAATLALYFGAKLALIRVFPQRFGHLKFP